MKIYDFFVEFKFCLECAKSPVSSFEAVKWEDRGSVKAGLAVVFLFFVTMVLDAQLTGFIFNPRNPEMFSVVSVFMVTVGGFFVVFVAHYAVSTFLPSEATLRQLFITLSYPLVPFIILRIVFIVLSNFATMEMGVFLSVLNTVGIGWSIIALILGMIQTHRLSFGMVLGDLALTVVGTVAILFFMLLLFSLFQQLNIFFYTILNEIMFRL